MPEIKDVFKQLLAYVNALKKDNKMPLIIECGDIKRFSQALKLERYVLPRKPGLNTISSLFGGVVVRENKYVPKDRAVALGSKNEVLAIIDLP